MRDLLLLTHFTGLIFGAGAGFAIFVIGFLSKRFPKESKTDVLLTLFPLRYISYIGLLLLVVSGVQLAAPLGAQVYASPLFVTKLAAVAGIVFLSIYGFVQMRLARNGNPLVHLKRLGVAGKINFILSLVVVGCAVYLFH